MTEYQTKGKRDITGLCSEFFRSEPTVIPVWFKPSLLTFPREKPLIMVGPGTGVAPFRAAIWELINWADCKEIVLIFGCRSKDADFYYKDEWTEISESYKFKLITAFSQDSSPKEYVQKKIE